MQIRAITSKIFAGAMYGVEAAGATPNKVAGLTAAVIDVFKSRNNNHNANQFFSTITGSKVDLDPQVQIFARRAMQIRRTACKRPETMERFRKSIQRYASKYKRDGTWPRWYRPEAEDGTGGQHDYPDEQPHPSTAEHDPSWDEDICAMGPIGLLIESTVWHGMKIDSNFNLWQKNEQPISIMKTPYQSLKPLVTKAAARARNRAEWHRGASTRRARAPLETDSDLSRIAPTIDEEGKGILRVIQMGGNLAGKEIAGFNENVSSLCSYCNGAVSTQDHIKWECSFFAPTRMEIDAELATIPHKCIPTYIKNESHQQ